MSIGLEVMIKALFGHGAGSSDAIRAAVGKEIASVSIDDAIRVTFKDGGVLTVRDDSQSCCESRYITCDDDLMTFAGDVLVSVEDRDGPEPERGPDDYGDHEVVFIEFTTARGSFTACTHNEHNGYYGGFSLVADFAPGE